MTEQDIVYLDNAATTFPKPEAVYIAMDSFYRQYGGNAGRGANPLARKASALVDETRILAQTWLNVPEVVFTSSATVALNTAILGARLRTGDIVYTTPFEHNSVLRPLEYLRQNIGIEIKLIPFDKITFACDLDKLVKQFQLDKPAMVCITQASNVTGYMPPVEQIIQYAKQANSDAVTIVDGAQVAGLKTIDMTNVDALIFSGHKSLYG
ncbi:MAG: cysteine desulfurase, partial [Phototrophicales bacterium]